MRVRVPSTVTVYGPRADSGPSYASLAQLVGLDRDGLRIGRNVSCTSGRAHPQMRIDAVRCSMA
jgi:hypothetical protein